MWRVDEQIASSHLSSDRVVSFDSLSRWRNLCGQLAWRMEIHVIQGESCELVQDLQPPPSLSRQLYFTIVDVTVLGKSAKFDGLAPWKGWTFLFLSNCDAQDPGRDRYPPQGSRRASQRYLENLLNVSRGQLEIRADLGVTAVQLRQRPTLWCARCTKATGDAVSEALEVALAHSRLTMCALCLSFSSLDALLQTVHSHWILGLLTMGRGRTTNEERIRLTRSKG